MEKDLEQDQRVRDEDVETLPGTTDKTRTSGAATPESETTTEEKKAIEIQREVHEHNPTGKDAIKALFMWRDSPEERLRDGK